jgi:hypothetical protein
MKKTGRDGEEVGKRFRKHALTGLQAIASTQKMTALIGLQVIASIGWHYFCMAV